MTCDQAASLDAIFGTDEFELERLKRRETKKAFWNRLSTPSPRYLAWLKASKSGCHPCPPYSQHHDHRKKRICISNKFCPPRVDQLALPTPKRLEANLCEFHNTLQPARVVNIVKMIHVQNTTQPVPHSSACKPRKRRKSKRKCERKKHETQWLEKQVQITTDLISRYLKQRMVYTPTYKQVMLSLALMRSLKVKNMDLVVRENILKTCEQLAIIADREWEPYKVLADMASTCSSRSVNEDDDQLIHVEWKMSCTTFSSSKQSSDEESDFFDDDDEEEESEGDDDDDRPKPTIKSDDVSISKEEPGLKEDNAESGPQRSKSGPQRSESGPQRSESGTQRSESGPQRSESGPQRSESGPQRSESGPQRSESGPQRSESGPQRSESEPQRSKSGPQRSESGPQRSESGPQRSESGPQRSESGPQRSQSGPQRSESGPQRSESGPQRSKSGPQRSESGMDLPTLTEPAAEYAGAEIGTGLGEESGEEQGVESGADTGTDWKTEEELSGFFGGETRDDGEVGEDEEDGEFEEFDEGGEEQYEETDFGRPSTITEEDEGEEILDYNTDGDEGEKFHDVRGGEGEEILNIGVGEEDKMIEDNEMGENDEMGVDNEMGGDVTESITEETEKVKVAGELEASVPILPTDVLPEENRARPQSSSGDSGVTPPQDGDESLKFDSNEKQPGTGEILGGGDVEGDCSERPCGSEMEESEEGSASKLYNEWGVDPNVVRILDVHPPGTASYVSYKVYSSWLEEFGENIQTYSGCLKNFRIIMESNRGSKHASAIKSVLANWSSYLSETMHFENEMKKYFKGKQVTRCRDCADYTIYNVMDSGHEIPQAMLDAIEHTGSWKSLLTEAEEYCKIFAGAPSPVSRSFFSSKSFDVQEVLSLQSEDTSAYLMEEVIEDAEWSNCHANHKSE